MNPAYLTIHGSHAYGLNTPTSDMDQRGFFFWSKQDFFGLRSGPEQIETKTENLDYVIWEFRKFVRLAAASNPNVLETLFTDQRDVLIRDSTGVAAMLREHAQDWFLSKKVETTFGGFARQQFTRLSKNFDKWDDPGVRKDAMHCVRLIYMAQEMLTTGNLTIKFDSKTAPEKVNFMLAIRRGQAKVIPVLQWAEQNLENLKTLRQASRLPDEPKLDTIEDFVYSAMKLEYEG